jgi:hypothetical protein
VQVELVTRNASSPASTMLPPPPSLAVKRTRAVFVKASPAAKSAFRSMRCVVHDKPLFVACVAIVTQPEVPLALPSTSKRSAPSATVKRRK